MPGRGKALTGATAFTVLFMVCGAAIAARTYSDPVGDSRLGPDLTSVAVSHTSTNVTFRIRFASSPALRVNRRDGWIDMLLLGIDVPPIGPRPVAGGDWLGADFAGGFHGPATTGMLVRLGKGASGGKTVARFEVVTRGSTVTFTIPRRALGRPTWFRFQVAVAREWSDEATAPSDAMPDFAPARGTFRHVLAG